MRKIFAIAICMVIIIGCKNNVAISTTNTNTYTVPDDSAITKAVHDAYACICFKDGKPNYEGIRNYFVPQAQLINFRTDTAAFTNLNQFIDLYKGFVESNHITLFQEAELYGKTEQFGKIAHRISVYKTYLNTMDSASERGVNSFQVIKTPTGWKVSSIIWDVEKPSLPIPAYYSSSDTSGIKAK